MTINLLWKTQSKKLNKKQAHTYQSKKYLKSNLLLFVLPSFVGVVLFVLLPSLDVINRSFMDAMGKKYVGVSNYISVISSQAYILAIKNTLLFVFFCIPLLLTISLALSLLLFRMKGKLSSYIQTLLLLPLSIPVASISMLWNIFFHQQGLFNSFLNFFNLNTLDWMNTKWSFWVLVCSYIWKNTGYTCILWLAGLSNISKEVYEAAQIDGANSWFVFTRITVPLLKPTFFLGIVISIINSFKVFREAYLVSGNYPHNSIYLLQHLFNNWFAQLDMQKLCAASILLFLLISGLIFYLAKYLTRND